MEGCVSLRYCLAEYNVCLDWNMGSGIMNECWYPRIPRELAYVQKLLLRGRHLLS